MRISGSPSSLPPPRRSRAASAKPARAKNARARAFSSSTHRSSLPALACARSAVSRALDLPVEEGLAVEADVAALAYTTEDAAEGMRAFVEKRRPDFRDR